MKHLRDENKASAEKRINIIKGQLDGLNKMIDQDHIVRTSLTKAWQFKILLKVWTA